MTATPPSPRVLLLLTDQADGEVMRHAAEMLERFGVPYEQRVAALHAPSALAELLQDAESRGTAVIIAGSRGGVSLAAACAAHSLLPVLGVPLPGPNLAGLDALLATVQAPAQLPVATLALGKAGAANAALLAVAILANSRPELRAQLEGYRAELAAKVLGETLP
ncbi:MAG: AIR carboxylase family protein [Pirellulales bacterium]|nr:AIR carboxylase family protein [Pirellulales bacterium]